MKQKFLREILRDVPQSRNFRTIHVRKEDLFALVGKQKKSVVSFCTLLTLLIVTLWLIIDFTIFLVNDVIFFREDINVNQSGVLMPSKACRTEQAMFLFNTSDLWANTGIQLHEGDRIKISASGAFHTAIRDVNDSAMKNKRLRHEWISVNGNCLYPINDNEENTLLTLSPGSPFGTLLYQIRGDGEPCLSDWSKDITLNLSSDTNIDEDRIKSIKDTLATELGVKTFKSGNKYIDITQNGILHLSVNDIYLNDKVIDEFEKRNLKIAREKSLTTKSKLSESEDLAVPADYKSYFMLFHTDTIDSNSIYIAGEKFRNFFKKYRDVWFKDNIGQIAVMLDIQRQIPNWAFKHQSWYRFIETQILEIPDNPWNILYLVLEFFLVIPALFILTYTIFAFLTYWIIYGAWTIWEYMFNKFFINKI